MTTRSSDSGSDSARGSARCRASGRGGSHDSGVPKRALSRRIFVLGRTGHRRPDPVHRCAVSAPSHVCAVTVAAAGRALSARALRCGHRVRRGILSARLQSGAHGFRQWARIEIFLGRRIRRGRSAGPVRLRGLRLRSDPSARLLPAPGAQRPGTAARASLRREPARTSWNSRLRDGPRSAPAVIRPALRASEPRNTSGRSVGSSVIAMVDTVVGAADNQCRRTPPNDEVIHTHLVVHNLAADILTSAPRRVRPSPR
jgi:hypothetical protein